MDTMTACLFGLLNRDRELMVFDWDYAARIIREYNPVMAYAGLQGDWDNTAGIIFHDGRPIKDTAYLASTWATPEIELEFQDGNSEFISCYKMQGETPGWNSSTIWPKSALDILAGREGESDAEGSAVCKTD